MTVLITIFVAGSLAFWFADYAFPPVEQTRLLVGVVVVWFVGGAILSWGKKNDDGDDADSYYPKKQYIAIALVPWLTCAAVLANALVDSSGASAHATTVVSRSRGRYGSSVSVISWRPGSQTIRIPVNGGCYNQLPPGKMITVMEKDGAFGIHWVSSIAECSQ